MSHCASCDGAFFTAQEVCVVGGGDSALDEALILAAHASRVTILHRSRSLVAQRALVDRASACDTIEIIPEAVVEEILGEDAVSGVRWRDLATGAVQTKAARGVFAYVGLEPNTAFLRDVVALDAAGHIETDAMMRTSLRGVFAAGDIRKNSVAQLAAAAGDGATAAISAFRYLRNEFAKAGDGEGSVTFPRHSLSNSRVSVAHSSYGAAPLLPLPACAACGESRGEGALPRA